MRERIYLSLAQMGGGEQAFIKEAFDTNWVVPLGPNVDAFEKIWRLLSARTGMSWRSRPERRQFTWDYCNSA